MTTTHPDDLNAKSRAGRVWHAITQTFFKGLLAILPLAATVIVLVWLAGYLDAPGQLVINKTQKVLGIHEPYTIPGAGLLAGVVVIFTVGLLINAWLIQQMLMASESLLRRLPVAKTVLSSVRDLMGFFTKSGKEPAGQVVLVTLSNSGAKQFGFVTRQNLADLAIGPGAEDLIAVYCPFSYALGGFTFIVPRASVQPVDVSAEEAMRFALTAGMKKAEKITAPGETAK